MVRQTETKTERQTNLQLELHPQPNKTRRKLHNLIVQHLRAAQLHKPARETTPINDANGNVFHDTCATQLGSKQLGAEYT
jgi:hypothetical protein